MASLCYPIDLYKTIVHLHSAYYLFHVTIWLLSSDLNEKIEQLLNLFCLHILSENQMNVRLCVQFTRQMSADLLSARSACVMASPPLPRPSHLQIRWAKNGQCSVK